MVKALDNSVGRILDALETMGLDDQTIIIFTSDNGGLSTLARIAPTSELPLRAGKGWCYEGGIRIPTLIRAPGIEATGKNNRHPGPSAWISFPPFSIWPGCHSGPNSTWTA